MRTLWTKGFEERDFQKQLKTILDVCRLEIINSATKDDLIYLLKWLAERTIEEEENGQTD